MEALTRRHFRERIRHALGKRTLRDSDATALLGEPASTHPYPSNAFLNEKIDDALRMLNAECDLGFVNNIEVTVALTAEDGAQRVVLRDQVPSLYDTYTGDGGDIHTVKRAYLEIGSTLYSLTPIDREENDRNTGQYYSYWNRGQWETLAPGTPLYYWLEGNALYLLPGTDTAGTLHLSAGTGIIGFTSDADTLLQLPNDYHLVPVDVATLMVAESEQNNVEMQSYAGLYRLRVWGDGRKDKGGIGRIQAWKQGQTSELQASLFVRTGRVSVGRRSGDRTREDRLSQCRLQS